MFSHPLRILALILSSFFLLGEGVGALSFPITVNPGSPTVPTSAGTLYTDFSNLLVDTNIATTDGTVKDADKLGNNLSTYYQRRVTGTCPNGSPIISIDGAGNTTCRTILPPGGCGSANGTATTTAPASNLCSTTPTTYTPSAVTTTATGYTWTCTNVAVEACSAPRLYTVTFDANGGGGHAPTSKTVLYNNALGPLPTSPTRATYSFDGWFTAPTGGTSVTAATLITSNITVYAQWTLTPTCHSTNLNQCNIGTVQNTNAGSCGGSATWECKNGIHIANCTKANLACPTCHPTNANQCNIGSPSGYSAGSCNGNQTWTCSNGSYNQSCTKANPACLNCALPWSPFTANAILHGNSITAYQNSSVVHPATCKSQSRTCTDGSLGGSYTNSSCTVTYTYAWQTGSYGSCSASCGPGTQTRSVWCERNDGTTVADAFCGGGKPGTTQACNNGPCNYCNPTLPTCSGLGHCTLTYNPTGVNQSWSKNASNCGFSCNTGWGGASCNTPVVDCIGSWSDTATCSVSCGGGVRQQVYTITTPASGGGAACSNNNGDTRWGSTSCNTGTCPACNPTLPTCSGLGRCTLTTGTPSIANQSWVLNATNCGYSCTGGWSGGTCSTCNSVPSSNQSIACSAVAGSYGIPATHTLGTAYYRIETSSCHANYNQVIWTDISGCSAPATWEFNRWLGYWWDGRPEFNYTKTCPCGKDNSCLIEAVYTCPSGSCTPGDTQVRNVGASCYGTGPKPIIDALGSYYECICQ